jgi:hypothetical protein
MAVVPWAPPKSDPALTAVEAPRGAILSQEDYLGLLAQRVHQLIRREGVAEARVSIRLDHDFLSLNPNHWAAQLLEAGELVQTRLAEQIPGQAWPLKVAGYNPLARKALEEVDLPGWLNLAVPRGTSELSDDALSDAFDKAPEDAFPSASPQGGVSPRVKHEPSPAPDPKEADDAITSMDDVARGLAELFEDRPLYAARPLDPGV